MEKLKNKSALFSVLSTIVLSLGLILGNAGVELEPMVTEVVVAGCAMLTAVGVITTPDIEKKSDDEEQNSSNEE